ncbi:rhodanese-like domain-containing protein [Brevibacillus dissolubilis]|uniref:rhodanese-like domain-containing protein n=1 Tax=Brevibacillus dissolubilis TaxID=1844116 RepID=UPI00210026DF|nr:rhodanese-like domain-containing protein [Brevibacillus dissolubilis]
MTYLFWALVLLFAYRMFRPIKGLTSLSPAEVEERLSRQQGQKPHFIDVREAHEYNGGHIRGFYNIPLSQLSARMHELSADRPIILTCQSGMRSRRAAQILLGKGFSQVSHLKTGVSGWKGKLER